MPRVSKRVGRLRWIAAAVVASLLIFTLQYAVISNIDPDGMATAVDQSSSLLPVRWTPLYRALAFVAPVVRQPLRAILRKYLDRVEPGWQSKGRLVAEGTVAREQVAEAAANTAIWMAALLVIGVLARRRSAGPEKAA